MPSPSARRRRKTRNFKTAVPISTPLVGPWLRGTAWSIAKIASVLMITGLTIALFQMSESYAFFVYEATIQGNSVLSLDEIYAASEIHEQSVFWLSPREIASRIEAHPYVERASVHCRLPGTVSIEVIERRPRIIWLTGEGERWIDADAVTLPPLGKERPPILLLDDEGQAARQDGTFRPDIAESILLVSRSMPDVSQFRYDPRWGLLFQSPHGWSVALGQPDRMGLKVSVLTSVQDGILARGEHPQLIDMRWPDSPYYR